MSVDYLESSQYGNVRILGRERPGQTGKMKCVVLWPCGPDGAGPFTPDDGGGDDGGDTYVGLGIGYVTSRPDATTCTVQPIAIAQDGSFYTTGAVMDVRNISSEGIE